MKEIAKKIIVKILILESKLILKKYKPKIAAITGSVGKTSAKDAVFTALSGFYYTRKSEKSYNSEIGLPLTVIGEDNPWSSPIGWLKVMWTGLLLIVLWHDYPEWLVLEVGVGKPGDMARTAGWLVTDMVVITHFGTVPVHVEFFSSIDEVKAEKKNLIKTLKKGGSLILNADDMDVASIADEPTMKAKYNIFTYSLVNESTCTATNFTILYDSDTRLPSGINFKAEIAGSSVPVFVNGGVGISHITSPLLAITAGHALCLPLLDIAMRFKDAKHAPGRMRLVPGINGSMIIDDSYNSSPAALAAALDVVSTIKVPGRKILILGDMLELGKYTTLEHERIGTELPKGIDMIVTVGKRAKDIGLAAIAAKRVKEANVAYFDTAIAARDFIEEKIQKGDLILIKGSQGVRLERVTATIMADPDMAAEYLPRQDEEWKNR